VKGARDVMIQTPKPIPTRLDPRAASSKSKAAAQKRQDVHDADDAEDDDGYRASPGKKKAEAIGGYMNKALFALLLLIALMLGYSMFSDKISRAVRAWNDTRSMKALRSTTTAMPVVTTDAATPATTATSASLPQQPAMLPPQPIVTKVISSERAEKAEKLYKEQQKTIAKMAELIRKKIDVMESRIETLSKKLEAVEKEVKKKDV